METRRKTDVKIRYQTIYARIFKLGDFQLHRRLVYHAAKETIEMKRPLRCLYLQCEKQIFVSYDAPESLTLKYKYVLTHKLAGSMF